MLPSLLRFDRSAAPARWWLVAVLTLVAAALAAAPRPAFVPLPHRPDATIAGMAAGMAVFALARRLARRRRALLP
jgi:hypothetical protein